MSIQLKALRFRYGSQAKEILHIPKWEIAQGEQVFLHGASGTGKSTLLNLLSGLLPVSEGEVTLLGQRLDQMTSRQRDRFRARHIGYVFQQFNLIPYLNAIENIQLAASFAQGGKQVCQTSPRALLAELNMPESVCQQAVASLSIGQQQRVAIARALINQPEVMIVDEASSSLDQKNRDAFMSLLMSMVSKNKMTLLFVSHDMSLARDFKTVKALTEINQAQTICLSN